MSQKRRKTIKSILIITSISLSFLIPAFGQTYEIKQEMFTFRMPLTKDVTTETFVITKATPKNKFVCHPPVAHFRLGSSVLSPTGVNTILSALKKCRISQSRSLLVTGYTCPLGSDQLNQTLSLHRAEAVARFLQTHGFTVATVQGKGAQNPVTNDPHQFHLNRRVTVRVVKK